MWMEFIFTLIFIIGVTFYMDKMTMRSKGHHAETIRTTYKSEGDELQTYYMFSEMIHI